MVTSPFLYCFSRLAILEPMLTTLMLAALNLTVRLPRMRRPVAAAAVVGVLFTLMMLTKTTAIFLLPAIGWAMFAAFWDRGEDSYRCNAIESANLVPWLRVALCCFGRHCFRLDLRRMDGPGRRSGYFGDYKFLFFINKYVKPTEFYWPLLSFWWSARKPIWIDRILIPLGATLIVIALAVAILFRNRKIGPRGFCLILYSARRFWRQAATSSS